MKSAAIIYSVVFVWQKRVLRNYSLVLSVSTAAGEGGTKTDQSIFSTTDQYRVSTTDAHHS